MPSHLPAKGTMIGVDDPVLVTGAGGFIGTKVVEALLDRGFPEVRCLVRAGGSMAGLARLAAAHPGRLRMLEGNLLSREDCTRAAKGVALVYHLAAGMEKTFAGCFMNSVVATRNLLDALLETGSLKRFVNVSSMAVYSNAGRGNGTIDESSETDLRPAERHEAYMYGKAKQDEMVLEYGARFGLPHVIVRPGDVFGPGRSKISGKIGIDTFGVFLKIGGRNQVPLTYVDNCAEAIMLAGLREGIEGEVFNVVDDDLPTGNEFLKQYKRKVGGLKSISMPYFAFYFLCLLWEQYSALSGGQLPPVFNRRRCIAHWKKAGYSNRKIKEKLGWKPKVPMEAALEIYFDYLRSARGGHA